MEAFEEAGEPFSSDCNCSDWRSNYCARSLSSLLDFPVIWTESRLIQWILYMTHMQNCWKLGTMIESLVFGAKIPEGIL